MKDAQAQPRAAATEASVVGVQPVLVVAALLWHDGRLLVQQRPPDKALPLLWEFPGGKVEPHESCEAALRRECMEELGVQIRLAGLAWQAYDAAATRPVQLRFYHAALCRSAAEICITSAVQSAWLLPAELPALPFCPADIGLVEALAAQRVVSPT